LNWIDGVWVYAFRDVTTFTSPGVSLQTKRDRWEDNAWVNWTLFDYQHDNLGNLLETKRSNWFNEEWSVIRLYTFEYDAQQNLVSYLSQHSLDPDEYTNSIRRFYTYDNNNLLTEVIRDNWENDDWVFHSKQEYNYDERDNLSTLLTTLWNNENSTLEEDEITTYRYDFSSFVDELLDEKSGIKLYPNPNFGVFDLEFSDEQNEKFEIDIFSIEGKKVTQQELDANNGKVNINLSHLDVGQYILKFKSKKHIETKILFIQK